MTGIHKGVKGCITMARVEMAYISNGLKFGQNSIDVLQMPVACGNCSIFLVVLQFPRGIHARSSFELQMNCYIRLVSFIIVCCVDHANLMSYWLQLQVVRSCSEKHFRDPLESSQLQFLKKLLSCIDFQVNYFQCYKRCSDGSFGFYARDVS